MDRIFPDHGVRQAFETVKKVYAAAGSPENCAMTTGEGGHRYYKANAWLNEQCITIPLYYMHIPYGWAKDLDAEVGAYYNTFIQNWNWT